MKLIHGDCLEEMKKIPDGSVDMVCADPPYAITQNKWDSIIPLEPMWEQLRRVSKSKTAITMTASQPFTSILIVSNLSEFRYEWIWDKGLPTGFLDANKRPMRQHESVIVFGQKQPQYFPIMRTGVFRHKGDSGPSECYGEFDRVSSWNDQYYPTTIINFTNANQKGKQHPTQKPVSLMAYLIRTYTNKGDTVLDFCMGSGTTGVACVKTGRDFIGIDKEEKYVEIARKRIKRAESRKGFFQE